MILTSDVYSWRIIAPRRLGGMYRAEVKLTKDGPEYLGLGDSEETAMSQAILKAEFDRSRRRVHELR